MFGCRPRLDVPARRAILAPSNRNRTLGDAAWRQSCLRQHANRPQMSEFVPGQPDLFKDPTKQPLKRSLLGLMTTSLAWPTHLQYALPDPKRDDTWPGGGCE